MVLFEEAVATMLEKTLFFLVFCSERATEFQLLKVTLFRYNTNYDCR